MGTERDPSPASRDQDDRHGADQNERGGGDQYYDYITQAVWDARGAGLDWYLFDLAGLLDRLASRRYLLDPAARPAW
ncbi:MAG TPA: hypothetical protein VG028_05230 [Terriglobia bacterium]|nr:hypothetical protein [Terriglobia bacterium]